MVLAQHIVGACAEGIGKSSEGVKLLLIFEESSFARFKVYAEHTLVRLNLEYLDEPHLTCGSGVSAAAGYAVGRVFHRADAYYCNILFKSQSLS